MLWRKLWAVLLVLALVGVPMAGAVEESGAEEQAAPEVTYDPAAGSGGDPVPDSTAKAVLVMDAGSGTVLWEKNAHEVLEPASVTKIMTMLLVCEAVDAGLLTPDTMVTTSAHAAGMGGGQVYLEEGEQMSVDDMLKCIAVVSANDCAIAMAEHISGTEQLFVERMNRRAEELGLEDTHFTGCTGLFDDGEHYTSAYDVAVMSRELIGHELIKNYTTIWMDSIRGGKFELSNTNKLVYWYQGCTGLKTGYTSTAMYCLSATAERDGVEYIAVVMHGGSIESRNNDAKALLNYGFASYTLCPLRGAELPDIPVELGRSGSVRCEYDGGEYALVPKTGAEPEYELTLPERVAAPVAAGARMGTLRVSVGGELLREVPVVAAEDVARLGYFGLWGKLALSLFGL